MARKGGRRRFQTVYREEKEDREEGAKREKDNRERGWKEAIGGRTSFMRDELIITDGPDR